MANNVPDIIPAIFGATSNARVRTSMVFGSDLESGWNDDATNASGATGPFQILLPVHPDINATGAEDPTTATAYMLGAYNSAVAQVPSSLWSSNPELAAEQSVITAEQPGGPFPTSAVGPYGSEGTSVVNQDWSNTTNILTGTYNPGTNIKLTASDSSVPTLPGWLQSLSGLLGIALPGTGTGTSTQALTAIGHFLEDPQDAMERLGLIVFGGLIVIVGLVILAAGTRTGGRAASAVPGAAIGRASGLASGRTQDRNERLALQKQAYAIGERKVAVQEARQRRLDTNSQMKAPAIGKHKKSGGKHE
jgi:hypothetical protein